MQLQLMAAETGGGETGGGETGGSSPGPPSANVSGSSGPRLFAEDGTGFFSIRKPKNALSGLSSGLKSIGKGVVAGAAGLIAAPIIGAQNDGVKGFAAGLGAGIAGAVVMPVTAVGVCVYQVGRGVANTPASISDAVNERQSIVVFEEPRPMYATRGGDGATTGSGGGAAGGASGSGAGGHVRDTELYDVLGVQPDADQNQIKRAYFMKAREQHPDKNPDNPDAHEMFQRLGQAYQVLSDPTTRRQYDQRGSEAVGADFVDPTALFTMLFGSEKFDRFVGELKVTAAVTAASSEDADGPPSFTSDQAVRQQAARELFLAAQLREMLEPWAESKDDEFIEWALAEGARLCKASYGEAMLNVVGRAYSRMGNEMLKRDFDGTFIGITSWGASSRRKYRGVKQAFGVATTAMQLMEQQKKMDEAMALAAEEESAAAEGGEEGSADAEAKRAARQSAMLHAQEETMTLFMKAIWRVTVMDIEATVHSVVQRVIRDKSVTREVRKRRAEGIVHLGNIFEAVSSGPAAEDPTVGAMQQLERAARAVQFGRDDQADDAE